MAADLAARCACSAPDGTLRVLKDTGRPDGHLHVATAWQAGTGYLAVAHTRMATESAVTVLHSHPFVPGAGSLRGAQRLLLQLRHRAAPPEADGVGFDSDNDSEVAARYLAQRLDERGRSRRRPPAG